jgi:hypothetical protein
VSQRPQPFAGPLEQCAVACSVSVSTMHSVCIQCPLVLAICYSTCLRQSASAQCRWWYADGDMLCRGVCNHIDVVLDAVLALYVFVYFCRILCSVHAYFMHTVMRVECVDTGTISCTHEFVCFSLVHAVLLGAAGHGYVGHRLCGVYGIVCWCACMDIMCEWWLGRNRLSFACRLA